MFNTKLIKVWFLLATGVFLWGCASSRDVEILSRENAQQNARLQAQVSALQKEKEALSREFAVFRNEWKNDLTNESKKTQAELQLQLESLRTEIKILSTGLDEYKDFAKKPSRDVERVREDVILRTRVLEEKAKIVEERSRAQEERIRTQEERVRIQEERFKTLEDRHRSMEDRFKAVEAKTDLVASKLAEAEKAAAMAKEIPPETRGPITGVSEIYKEAFETYQRGDMEGARKKFEAFLKQYPNTELSDNAQFWIGETYYAKKDYERAILEYEKAIAKYPEGDKVPAAMLKQAFAFLELGDKSNGRNLLRRVMERYPRSEQAEAAKKRLETIR